MAYFDWNSDFETGIPEIDAQHRTLVGHVNKLVGGMRDGIGDEIVGNILNNLEEYSKTHFKLEEKAFYRYQFAETERHTKEHSEFIQKITELKEAYRRKEVLLSNKLLTFMVDWVRNHILFEDMKYVPTLKGKSLKYL
jgi:hemerythrin-like metal-binding protein